MQLPNIEINSRRLEQFLFLHDIHFISQHKDPLNATVWVYPDTQEVRRVIAEYRDIVARRNERRMAACT